MKYFKFLGLDLVVINEVGCRLQHDGLFACAFINFLKDTKSNSGMIEWIMFNNFVTEIQIYTNK